MEKIQQLLNEQKDKLWDWEPLETILTIDWILIIETDSGNINSLSNLLFDTPFLSWLEWKEGKDTELWMKSKSSNPDFIEWYNDMSYNYHKINLALLSTDEERIKYVEEHVFTDIDKWEQDAKELEDEINSKIKEWKRKVEGI